MTTRKEIIIQKYLEFQEKIKTFGIDDSMRFPKPPAIIITFNSFFILINNIKIYVYKHEKKIYI